jgi:hypothetical protein
VKKLLLLAPVLFAPAAFGQVSLQLMGDVDYVWAQRPAAAPLSTFSIPTFNVFASGAQGRVSYLAELVFESGESNSFELDLERIEVGYVVNNQLRLRAGRFHTAFGYYNDAYHHGAYYELTASRPLFVHFEDRGGLLPAHSVGLHADGRFGLGAFGALRYDLELANGRGNSPGEIVNFADARRSKQINLRVRYQPDVEGLLIGANALYGRYSLRGAEGEPPRGFREWILGGHAAWLDGEVHLIAEAALVDHAPIEGGPSLRSFGAFVEAGYAFFGAREPYLRWERVAYASGDDPLYTGGSSRHVVTTGVKWTATSNAALKLQLHRDFPDQGEATFRMTAQVAYAF